jgi:hypothetical protein
MSNQPPRTESEIVEFVRAIDVRAPRELHAGVEALVAERAPAVAGRGPMATRWGLLAGVPALAAVIVVALVVGLAGGGGSPPTLEQTVALTLQPPTMNAPDENPHDGGQLAVAVDGVPFPYWEESFGFRATGARVDDVDGRKVTTVFYADGEKNWLGYAIVSGTPAPRVTGGVVIHHDGASYRLLTAHGARVVVWERGGRLCVVAGHGVSNGTLLALASWDGVGARLAA